MTSRFYVLAHASDIEIYVHVDSYISFFTSPYTVHFMGAAVDISVSEDFGREALSPVSGFVDKVIEYRSPGVESVKDYIISITPKPSASQRVKIMHVKPLVRPGEYVEIGDPLGLYIKTGFFSYHHLPHIHVEVCRDSSLRPSMAIPLSLERDNELSRSMHRDDRMVKEKTVLKTTIYRVRENYALCGIEDTAYGVRSSISNISGYINAQIGLGLGHASLIFNATGMKPAIDAILTILGAPVGIIRSVKEWYALAIPVRKDFEHWLMESQSINTLLKREEDLGEKHWVKILLNKNIPVAGIEFLLSRKAPIKLIPPRGYNYREILREGDVIEITLRPQTTIDVRR